MCLLKAQQFQMVPGMITANRICGEKINRKNISSNKPINVIHVCLMLYSVSLPIIFQVAKQTCGMPLIWRQALNSRH